VLPLLRASNSTRTINARKVRVDQSWRSEHLLTSLPGKTVDHQFAKELLAGFVGGEVDKLVETHGMNEYDKYEAHKHAKKHAEQFYDQHYIQNERADMYNPNQYGPPQPLQNYQGGYNQGY
jgi:hypothetical protein